MPISSFPHLYVFFVPANLSAKDVTAAAISVMEWMNQEVITVATKTPASLLVLLFLMIDKFTLAYVYFFAWFYLPEQKQRTFLLYTAVVHFIAGAYQLPWLDDQITNAPNLQMIDLTIAGFGLLTWIAPPLLWKKKID